VSDPRGRSGVGLVGFAVLAIVLIVLVAAVAASVGHQLAIAERAVAEMRR
jgi:hypothetical protein